MRAVSNAGDARVGSRAVDTNPVADAKAGISRLGDTHCNAVAKLNRDVLARPAIGIAILYGIAGVASGEDAGDGCEILATAAAELMAEHAACDCADDRAHTQLMVAFQRYGIDPH